jgi:hypothetical protein
VAARADNAATPVERDNLPSEYAVRAHAARVSLSLRAGAERRFGARAGARRATGRLGILGSVSGNSVRAPNCELHRAGAQGSSSVPARSGGGNRTGRA